MGKRTESRRPAKRKVSKPTAILNQVWQRKKLGKYNLLAILGKGAMGGVFRAEDDLLKRQVALKVLPQKLGDDDGNSWGIEQFIREARSAAAIQHPNVTHIYEIGEEDGYYYIAMELIEGGDLESEIKKGGKFTAEEACRIISECASGLHHAHDMGVVHRDVKPANVMLTKDRQAKLTDFGLARMDDPDDEFSLPTEMVGTPKYVAPEVCLGQPATSSSDIYSLGATMWYLLTGEAPFNEKDPRRVMAMQVRAPLPDLSEKRPDLPKSLISIIERSLAKKPEDRFKTCGDFAEVLANFGAEDDDELSTLATAISDVGTSMSMSTVEPVRRTSSRNSGALNNKRAKSGGRSNASMTDSRMPKAKTSKQKNDQMMMIIAAAVGVVLVVVVVVVLVLLFAGKKPTETPGDGGGTQTPGPGQSPSIVTPGDTNPGGVTPGPGDQKNPDPTNPQNNQGGTNQQQASDTDWANETISGTFQVGNTRIWSVADNGGVYEIKGLLETATTMADEYRLMLKSYRNTGTLYVSYDGDNVALRRAIAQKLGATETDSPPVSASGKKITVKGRITNNNSRLFIHLESADQIALEMTSRTDNSDTPDNTDTSVVDKPDTNQPDVQSPDIKEIDVVKATPNNPSPAEGPYGQAHYLAEYLFDSRDPNLPRFIKQNMGLARITVQGRVTYAGPHPNDSNRYTLALSGHDPNTDDTLYVHFDRGNNLTRMLRRFRLNSIDQLMNMPIQITGRMTYQEGSKRLIFEADPKDVNNKYGHAIDFIGQPFLDGKTATDIYRVDPRKGADVSTTLRTHRARDVIGWLGYVVSAGENEEGLWIRMNDPDSEEAVHLLIYGKKNADNFKDMLSVLMPNRQFDAQWLVGKLVYAAGRPERAGKATAIKIEKFSQLAINGANLKFIQVQQWRNRPIEMLDTELMDKARRMQLLVALKGASSRAMTSADNESRWIARFDNDVAVAISSDIIDEVVSKLGLASRNDPLGDVIVIGRIAKRGFYGKYTVFVDRVDQIVRQADFTNNVRNSNPDIGNVEPVNSGANQGPDVEALAQKYDMPKDAKYLDFNQQKLDRVLDNIILTKDRNPYLVIGEVASVERGWGGYNFTFKNVNGAIFRLVTSVSVAQELAKSAGLSSERQLVGQTIIVADVLTRTNRLQVDGKQVSFFRVRDLKNIKVVKENTE